MAVFYWVGGYTGSTSAASGYHITGNYWTNWVTGLTSTIGDVFYSPYAWNVRENWRLEHTGQVQVSPNIRVIRDSVPTRLPGGDDTVIVGGVPAYIGTGPAGGNTVYVENLAPHNFSLLFGGMSGSGITSDSGLTLWASGGRNPCILKVQEKFTQLNKTWGDVAYSWANTAIGLTSLQIRTGEIGSWGLKYVWGDSRQGLSGESLGRALSIASNPLNLILGDGSKRAQCFVNRKESSLSATGGATIHIKAVNYDAGITSPSIDMMDRVGYGDPFPPPFGGAASGTGVYGTKDTPALNHYLVLQGTWTDVKQGCGNTHLEDAVEIQNEFELGKNPFDLNGAVGHVVATTKANVNRFNLHPSHVYGSGGNAGINIECFEQSAVPAIITTGWKNQSPFNCLTIGSLSESTKTISYLRTISSDPSDPIVASGVNPRSISGLSASGWWRQDYPWYYNNWFTGPIVNTKNVILTEIDHQGGVILPDSNSNWNHYLIIQNGYISYPAQILGRIDENPAWKNFLIGYSPSDAGVIPTQTVWTFQGQYANPNFIIPYDGQAITLTKTNWYSGI